MYRASFSVFLCAFLNFLPYITVLSAYQKSAVSGLSQIRVLTKSVFSEVNSPFEFDEKSLEAVITDLKFLD